MSRRDRRGPGGQGPTTGRGTGGCADSTVPEFKNPQFPMGAGRGRGGGGRGGGGGGRGRQRGMGGGGRRGLGGGGGLGRGSTPDAGPEQSRPPLSLRALERSVDRSPVVRVRQRLCAVVDAGRCTGCGICVDVCALQAVTLDGHAVVALDRCAGCGACIAECPRGAISVVPQVSVSSTDAVE